MSCGTHTRVCSQLRFEHLLPVRLPDANRQIVAIFKILCVFAFLKLTLSMTCQNKNTLFMPILYLIQNRAFRKKALWAVYKPREQMRGEQWGCSNDHITMITPIQLKCLYKGRGPKLPKIPSTWFVHPKIGFLYKFYHGCNCFILKIAKEYLKKIAKNLCKNQVHSMCLPSLARLSNPTLAMVHILSLWSNDTNLIRTILVFFYRSRKNSPQGKPICSSTQRGGYYSHHFTPTYTTLHIRELS